MNHSPPLPLLLTALLLGACATQPTAAEQPDPSQLGNRIRCRIAGRGDVPSITSAQHRVLLVVCSPDGRREAIRIHSFAYDGSESLSGSLGIRTKNLFDLPQPKWAESLHGDPQLAHDLQLPDGYTLCFDDGAFLVYRRVGESDRFVADTKPEIAFGQISADGSRYLELRPVAGAEIGFYGDPPGWPPAAAPTMQR